MAMTNALKTAKESPPRDGELEIDLNSASEEQLAGLPPVGPEKARMLVLHRPFDSWIEVRRLPGFSAGLIDDLKSGGARLGVSST